MSSSNSNPPCAACKFLRRKCLPGCVFSPYFPPEEPQKFVNVHKIFGASNVSKLLSEIQPHQREDAVNSLAYEAEARLKDPVYGCVGAISVLQTQVLRLQKELEATNADLMRFASANNNNNNNNAAEIMSTSSSSGYSPVGKPAAAAGHSLNGHRSLSFNLQRMTMAGGGHPHNMAMMMQLQQQNGRSRMTEGGDCGGGGLQLHNYAPSQGMTTTDYYYSSAWSNSSSGGEHNSDGADNGDCSM